MSLAPGTVLIVDDEAPIRLLLARILRSLGLDVVTAIDGVRGLEVAHSHPVDLILLDSRMPGLSGPSVLRHLKSDQTTRDIPVIMVSAENDLDTIVACITQGAEDYLVKPFTRVILEARVSSCLEKRRLRAQEERYRQTLEERVIERTALADAHRDAFQRQSAMLESILTSIADGVVVADLSGQLQHHNPAAAHILGERLHLLLPASEAGPDADEPPPTSLRFPLVQAIRGQSVEAMEVHLPAEEGRPAQWLRISAQPQRDAKGEIIGGVAVVHDISASKLAEQSLRESEQRYALAARGSNDGLWDWNLQTNQIYYSPRWKAMLGYAEDELSSMPAEWFDRVHPDDQPQLHARIAAHQRRLISHFEHEYRIQAKDGSYRWMLCRGLAVWASNGTPVRMAGSQTDITLRKQAEAQLAHDALHDSLTGLPNRALFINRVEHILAHDRRGEPRPFAVLFLDLDGFKTINDSLGHAAGDELLIAVARRLEGCLRSGDTVARLGGDEFTILLEAVSDTAVIWEIAERAHQALASPVELSGRPVYVTASIGIALSGRGEASAAELIQRADTAMYHAKLGGKARVALFDPAMHAHALRRLQLESDLHGAIERGELCVHYQPIVALDSLRLVGVEALVRWQHPQRGLLLPGEFLDIAEEAGRMSSIGWWVLQEACSQLQQWRNEHEEACDLWVSVNIGAPLLAQPNLIPQIGRVLQETGLPPQALKLEITEQTLLEHGEATTRTLEAIRELGVQLCIDDFGTGYSSLSYLQRFPVNVLKIDRSFTTQLGSMGNGYVIVQTIMALARALALQVVAEGIETSEQARLLQQINCELGQGWLFAKAQPPEVISTMIGKPYAVPAPAVDAAAGQAGPLLGAP